MDIIRFITSSADPQKTSLAVKGALFAALPIVLAIAHVFGFNVDEATGSDAIGLFVTLIDALLTIIGTVMAFSLASCARCALVAGAPWICNNAQQLEIEYTHPAY